jgi:hypothetical protein
VGTEVTGPGTTTVTLIADDGELTNSCTTKITLVDNTPPQITCRDDDPLVAGNQIYVECANGRGIVPAGGASATDNCGPATTTCSSSPSSGTWLPLGGHASGSCTATDGSQNQNPCNYDVVVRDTKPPVTGTSKGMVLWPADGTLQEISLMDCANFTVDACSGRMNPLKDYGVITKVASDEEEDATGNSDGNTTGDIQIKKPWLALVRAERNQTKDGRVYTVYYQAKDPSGNVANGSCKVSVPRNQGNPAGDGPPLYCVGPAC